MRDGPFREAAETGIPVPDHDEERLILVTPRTPNFTQIRDILFQGEGVYPGDQFFPDRFGHGNIWNFSAPGTESKLVVAIATPTHIRIASAFMLSAQPELDGRIFLGDVLSDAEAARQASPEPLEDLEAVNLISPYSLSNFQFAENLQPPDDPKQVKGVRERFHRLIQHQIAGRYCTTTISPEPKYDKYLIAQPQNRALPPIRQGMGYAFYNAAQLAEGKKGHDVDMGFSVHMKSNHAYIGKFGEKNVCYTYAGRAIRNFNEQAYAQGLLPTAGYIRALLSDEEREKTVERPSTVRIARKALHRRSTFFISAAPSADEAVA